MNGIDVRDRAETIRLRREVADLAGELRKALHRIAALEAAQDHSRSLTPPTPTPPRRPPMPIPASDTPSTPSDGPAEAIDLEAIEARAKAAMEGPWTTCRSNADRWTGIEAPKDSVVLSCGRCDPPDAAFIAAARQDVPALVREVRALRAEQESLCKRLDVLHGSIADLERVATAWPCGHRPGFRWVDEDSECPVCDEIADAANAERASLARERDEILGHLRETARQRDGLRGPPCGGCGVACGPFVVCPLCASKADEARATAAESALAAAQAERDAARGREARIRQALRDLAAWSTGGLHCDHCTIFDGDDDEAECDCGREAWLTRLGEVQAVAREDALPPSAAPSAAPTPAPEARKEGRVNG